MLGRFPTAPQLLDSSKTDPYPIFDHMIEVRTDPAQLRFPKAIAIDSNTKEIYVLQDNPASISVFADIGKFIRIIRLENMSFPCGIAIHGDNIYLTDSVSHYIFHFRKETTGIYLVAKHEEYLQSIISSKFYRPKQLTISSKGDIFIADYWNDRVQILDSDLHNQGQISHDSLKIPEDIKLTTEEVYVLCIWGFPCIHVFSYTGEKIRSLPTSIHSSFFCLDSFGNIIITNRSTDQINIFTKHGILLDRLIKPGGDAGFIQNAQGIALIDDFKLVIVSSSAISLCLFS